MSQRRQLMTGLVLAAGALVAAIFGAYNRLNRPTPVAQPIAALSTPIANAQRVTGFSGFAQYASGGYEFVRLPKPSRAGEFVTLRSPSFNVARRVDVHEDAADPGFVYVPIARDSAKPAAEIQLCGKGDVPFICPLLMPGVRLDLLPTFDYEDAKRRAVHS